VALERAEVVVDLLPRQPNLGSQRAGLSWLGELGEKAGADGVERGLCRTRIVDDRYVDHGRILSPKNQFVKTIYLFGRNCVGMGAYELYRVL
jgi:hypothetical protein